jgi:hypothetical protein
MPDQAAQREAMKKFEFMVGQWSGDATVMRGPAGKITFTQTENVEMKLDGLVMLVEGKGTATDGKVMFQALGMISYDEAAKQYRFRAFNDGRYMDTELTPASDGKGFQWGLNFGPAKMHYTMQLNDKGEWVETGDLLMEGQPPRRVVDINVRRQSSQNVK